jgi:two-component system response regulator AtoC
VLLAGETGTGKELAARAVHFHGGRRERRFVPVNCGALPAELVESELFGHARGAFTGAAGAKSGLFEEAEGGTLFLDEIGELPLAVQVKLNRALQEREIRRVGDVKPIPVDVRVIAATHRELKAEVQAGRFREDLFYRLNVFPITIPPLRERRDDIPLLAQNFLNKFSAEVRKGPLTISDEAMEILLKSPWKGNVRELENVIERAVIYADGGVIRARDLGISESSIVDALCENVPMDGPLHAVAEAATRIAESRRIRQVLKQTGGNKSRAAEVLQVSYKTLLTKIKDYQLEEKGE